jgi:hypothetical protein
LPAPLIAFPPRLPYQPKKEEDQDEKDVEEEEEE